VITPRPHAQNTGFSWTDRSGAPRLLSRQQVADFDRDGYVLARGLFQTDVIDRLRADIDTFELQAEEFLRQQPGGTMFIATADQITFTVHLVTRCASARSFAGHPALVDLCHDLVGDDVRLYWDQAVYKKPEPLREFPWHQDNGYAFLEPQQYLTCWVPLTDATVHNGCPWVVPGAHRQGTLHHEPSPVGLQCLSDPEGAVPVEAREGDVVVFSSLTPHRTGPNTTDQTRKAYIVQYAPEGAHVVDAFGTRTEQNRADRQFAVLANGQRIASG
jgi:ectoine hydroxylase-related dioxygenase (phytanoyl-CoA dioxygenase family)